MAAAVVDDIEYFYDDRIKNFDAERLKITNYIGLIKPNQRELHILQWEGKQEAEAANNMDFELAEYNDDLRRVIKQTIETKLELQSRAQKHIANQSQIQQLGELSQPVLRDITYFFDDKYSLIAPIGVDGRKSSLLTMQKPKITKSMDAQGQAQGQIRGPSRPQAPKPLPKQAKTGEVLRLEARLRDETKRLYSKFEEFQALVIGIEASVAEAKDSGDRVLADSRNEAARMIAENDKYDHQCFLSVSELLKLRLRIMTAQREEMEELDRLTCERMDCEKKKTRLRNQLVADIKHLSETLENDKALRQEDFACQVQEVTDKCDVLKKEERIALSKKNLKSKKIIEKLQADVAYAQDRYERLKKRNVLEMEGYNNEAAMLRLRLSHVEKVFSARQRQSVRKQFRNKDSPRSTVDVSTISDSLGHSDRWT